MSLILNSLNNAFGLVLSRKSHRFLPLCLNKVLMDKNRMYQTFNRRVLLKGNPKVSNGILKYFKKKVLIS